VRTVNLAHAAGAECADDFVRAEARAGSEGQAAGLYGRSTALAQYWRLPSLPVHSDREAGLPSRSTLEVLPAVRLTAG
jgi:hypothetical protein